VLDTHPVQDVVEVEVVAVADGRAADPDGVGAHIGQVVRQPAGHGESQGCICVPQQDVVEQQVELAKDLLVGDGLDGLDERQARLRVASADLGERADAGQQLLGIGRQR